MTRQLLKLPNLFFFHYSFGMEGSSAHGEVISLSSLFASSLEGDLQTGPRTGGHGPSPQSDVPIALVLIGRPLLAMGRVEPGSHPSQSHPIQKGSLLLSYWAYIAKWVQAPDPSTACDGRVSRSSGGIVGDLDDLSYSNGRPLDMHVHCEGLHIK
jgi:hypothetical protein